MQDYMYQETNSASGKVEALYVKQGISRLQLWTPVP